MAGLIETKAISASNLKLKLKLTEAELGKNHILGINVNQYRTYVFLLCSLLFEFTNSFSIGKIPQKLKKKV